MTHNIWKLANPKPYYYILAHQPSLFFYIFPITLYHDHPFLPCEPAGPYYTLLESGKKKKMLLLVLVLKIHLQKKKKKTYSF